MKKLLLSVFAVLLMMPFMVEAAVPVINVDGPTALSKTAVSTSTDKYTIDYSEVADKTGMQIFYEVNESGTPVEITYDPLVDEVELTIKTSLFDSDIDLVKPINKIEFYATNGDGNSEVIEKKLLVYKTGLETTTDVDTGIIIKAMGYPVLTEYTITKVTEQTILDKVGLENVTLYKIEPKIQGETLGAGALAKLYKGTDFSYDLTYLRITLPLSAEVQALAGGEADKTNDFGFTMTHDFKFTRSSLNTATSTTEYEFAYSYSNGFVDGGFMYYGIGTGERTIIENPETPETPGDNNENPDTGDMMLFLPFAALAIGAGIFAYKNSKKLKHQ